MQAEGMLIGPSLLPPPLGVSSWEDEHIRSGLQDCMSSLSPTPVWVGALPFPQARGTAVRGGHRESSWEAGPSEHYMG